MAFKSVSLICSLSLSLSPLGRHYVSEGFLLQSHFPFLCVGGLRDVGASCCCYIRRINIIFRDHSFSLLEGGSEGENTRPPCDRGARLFSSVCPLPMCSDTVHSVKKGRHS